MQKKLLIDAFSNIMMFDGKTLQALGKPISLRELVSDKLYAFGDDLYLKSGDEYSLLAENAAIFSLTNPDAQADNQFSMIDANQFLYVDKRDGGIKPFPMVKGYLDAFFPQNGHDDSRQTPNRVIIRKGENEHLLGIQQKNSFSLIEEKAIGNIDALFWHGGLYTRFKDMFARCPVIIEHMTGHQMIVRADASSKYAFAILSTGKIMPLGIFNRIRVTEVSTILSTLDGGTEELWHLEESFMERIVAASFGTDSLSINADGSIVHSYKTDVGFDNGGIIDGTSVYRLNEKGHYVVCN